MSLSLYIQTTTVAGERVVWCVLLKVACEVPPALLLGSQVPVYFQDSRLDDGHGLEQNPSHLPTHTRTGRVRQKIC